jgi:prefoldin subunit 5
MAEERILRRTRAVSRGALRAVPTNTGDIEERMQSIARLQTEMTEKAEEVSRLTAEVEELMTTAKKTTHEAFGLVAEFVDVKTNSSTEVTVDAARKALKKDSEFYSVLKVQMAPLKKLLSEREITAISKVTPGAVTGTKFVITQPKKKVGKSKD